MDLYVQTLGDATPPLRLTSDGARVDWPAWSPDGTRLAFASRRDPAFSGMLLHTIRADGTGLARVRQQDAYDSSPAWLADGSAIVVANEWDPAGGTHLQVLSPTGAVLQRSSFQGVDPSIAPKTGRIAFVSRGDGTVTLTIGRPDGTDLRPVYADPSGQLALPDWGPME
jgi:Tol biopolymer transport system component